jgi:hypothetical protein
MQDLIEASVRGIGYAMLWLLTFGRYRSTHDSLLLEGGVGLTAVAAALYAGYALSAQQFLAP